MTTRGGIEWVRQHYGVDARLRRRVVSDGEPGRIAGTDGPHLILRLDSEPGRKVYAHPTWRMEYP